MKTPISVIIVIIFLSLKIGKSIIGRVFDILGSTQSTPRDFYPLLITIFAVSLYFLILYGIYKRYVAAKYPPFIVAGIYMIWGIYAIIISDFPINTIPNTAIGITNYIDAWIGLIVCPILLFWLIISKEYHAYFTEDIK
jgi:hypothetical protein